MSLTNIAALFSDIVETPQQRQQRLLAEGQASAAQFSELPTGIRELAMGIGSNIPRNVEAVRRFGVQAGLPMETQGEAFQRQIKGLDLQTEAGQKEAVRITTNIDPLRGAALAETFAQQTMELADRERINQLRDQNIAANKRSVELETQNKAARERIAENLREKGEASENLIDSYVRGVTTLGQIESAIRAGKSDDIRDAQEGRAKELFENRMTEWTQSQEDRESQEITSNTFKSTLLAQVKQSNETSDKDSVYTSLLESDANIPVSVLNQIKTNIENDAEPNVTFQTIFHDGKNIVAAIDRDTFEITPIADSRATPVSPRDIPLLNADTSGQIKSQIDSYPAWEGRNLFSELGGGKATAGQNLLIGIVHSYSQSQNVPQAQVLAMIDNQIQSPLGLEALKTGVLLPSSSMSDPAPEGIDQELWDAMTDEQKQEFRTTQ